MSTDTATSVRYTVVPLRGGMIGYYGLYDHLKRSRVIGVHLIDRDRLQGVADSWNAKERPC